MSKTVTTDARAPRSAPGVKVQLRERQVLFVAPDTEGTRKWGVYGCPDMERTADGSIVVWDGGHMDSHDLEAGTMAEPVAFRSTDNGLTWKAIKRDAKESAAGKIFVLSDGARVQFLPKTPPADLYKLGVRPKFMVMTANDAGLLGVFRHGDIPPAARTFEVRYQPAGAAAPQSADGVFDIPDWQVTATLKGKTGDGIWPDVTPVFTPLSFGFTGLHHGAAGEEALVEAPDGAWLSAIVHVVAMARNDRYFGELRCIASRDHGRTWTLRGSILNQRDLTTFGATEEFSMIRLGNEIICVDRTDHATIQDPHRAAVLARSADNGLTWSVPEPVASSSVTPHLVNLRTAWLRSWSAGRGCT